MTNNDCSEYLTVTAERRARFNEILNKIKSSELNFTLSKSSNVEYTVNNDLSFNVSTTASYCKSFRREPTGWYLQSILPGTPEEIGKYFSDGEFRMKYDTSVLNIDSKVQKKDEQTTLWLANEGLKSEISAVTPRQFTYLQQCWSNDNEYELIRGVIKSKEYPDKSGVVTGDIILYGIKITKINEKELNDTYKIPQIKLGDDKNLEFCKFELITQTDIKGWLPTFAVDAAISANIVDADVALRLYLLKNEHKLNITTK